MDKVLVKEGGMPDDRLVLGRDGNANKYGVNLIYLRIISRLFVWLIFIGIITLMLSLGKK